MSVSSVPWMTKVYSSMEDNCPTKVTARRLLITHYHTSGFWPQWRQGAWKHTPFLFARLFAGIRRTHVLRGRGGGEWWPITLCSWWMYWNKEKPRRLNCILLLLERTPKSYFLYKDYNNKSISLYYFICPLQAFLCTYQCTLLFWEQRVKISLTADIKVKDHKDAVRKTS